LPNAWLPDLGSQRDETNTKLGCLDSGRMTGESHHVNPRAKKKPRLLVIGSTGRVGSRVVAEIGKVDAVEAIYSSRLPEQVDAWRKDGKDAVLLDLDKPEAFPEALTGVDRLFLATATPSPWCIRARRLWMPRRIPA
jgi:hypothetical protein